VIVYVPAKVQTGHVPNKARSVNHLSYCWRCKWQVRWGEKWIRVL